MKPDAPRLVLQLKEGALRAQFYPPLLRIESTLENPSDQRLKPPLREGCSSSGE